MHTSFDAVSLIWRQQRAGDNKNNNNKNISNAGRSNYLQLFRRLSGIWTLIGVCIFYIWRPNRQSARGTQKAPMSFLIKYSIRLYTDSDTVYWTSACTFATTKTNQRRDSLLTCQFPISAIPIGFGRTAQQILQANTVDWQPERHTNSALAGAMTKYENKSRATFNAMLCISCVIKWQSF